MITDSNNSSEKYKSIYSTLFGLGITYFLTHAFKYWTFVSGPEGITWNINIVMFVTIQLYFFINYFRYLFGLRRFAEMTGEKFIPKESDWMSTKSNLFVTSVKNILKLLIVNVGVFQLLIFFAISFIIIPEVGIESVDSRNVYKYLDSNLVGIYKWFFKLDVLLLVFDVFAVIGFRYLDSDIQPSEKNEVSIWVLANGIEIACCLLALLVLRNGSQSDYTVAFTFVIIKFFMLITELLGGYYIFQRIKNSLQPKIENAETK
ncbi:hypothetical protein [Ferruginibacter sp. SUN106]|uniref:hypothetical protein n=1 Tax=Ferruginibacter sp. SUN106 TaxID=2978348 RepID=UPI003D35AC7F